MRSSPARADRRLALATVLCAVLAYPASAAAVATIGSNLQRAPNAADDPVNGPGATWALTGSSAPDGASSRVNGTIRTWRIRAGASVTPVSLRVLRPEPNSPLWTGAGTSNSVLPAPNAISTYSQAMPIAIGDFLGIDVTDPANGFYFHDPSFLFSLQWGPNRLPDGGPPLMPQAGLHEETAINADIEPTSEFEIERIKRLSKGRLKVRATLPNPGSLRADERLRSGSAARSATRRRELKTRTITVEGPRTVTFRLKPTRFARRQLKADRRVKVKMRLGFTPLFGDSTAVETKRKTLRR